MAAEKGMRRQLGALMISSVVALGVSVISSTAKAEDDASRFTYGGNKPTSRAFIAEFGAHWGAADLQTHLNHLTPAVQLFTVLRGVFSITVTDGETRQLHAGDLVQLEDITPCRGHITVVGDKPGFLLFAR